MAESDPGTAEAAPAEQTPGVEVQEADLPEAAPGPPAAAGGGQIDILLDTTLPVEVRLGQIETPARELLQLGPGSVLKLDKQVGEPVDLFLRGIRFATAQLVVVGDRLGVRIKEVLSPGGAPAATTKAT